jgi:hypothetical protein
VKILVRFAWLSCALVVVGLFSAWVSGSAGLKWSRRTDSCVRCGAQKNYNSRIFCFFGMALPVSSSVEIKKTALTDCWTQYAAGCEHDWAFIHFSSPTAAGHASLFGSYPIYNPDEAEKFARVIRWLDVMDARPNALRAIGDRTNLLRFAAAGLLSAQEERPPPVPAAWWATNARYFVIVTDKVAATKLTDALEEETNGELSFELISSRTLIRNTH